MARIITQTINGEQGIAQPIALNPGKQAAKRAQNAFKKRCTGQLVKKLPQMCKIFLFGVGQWSFVGVTSKKPKHCLACELGLYESPIIKNAWR